MVSCGFRKVRIPGAEELLRLHVIGHFILT